MNVQSAAPLRVALTSLGCKVNYAEMSELAGTLAAAGCDVVPEHESADVRVLNSCTVTLQADATTRQRLRRLRESDPGAMLILTGCSVDANPDAYRAKPQRHPRAVAVDAVFPNARKSDIADYVLQFRPLTAARATQPPLRSRAFIKVQDGCNHRCTYCIVWRARGTSISVAPGAVLERAEQAIEDGFRELVLTGVDLGSYGRDRDSTLAHLLEQLLNRVGAEARVRLSSVNANDVTPALIELNAHPRLCAHWHMPLQSGSDNVLRAMHRGYRRSGYLRRVDALRTRRPDTQFTTDVMVAFPGESAHDHAQTLSLIDEVGFLSCHVFRWSPRPDTPAVELHGRVDDATARRRSAEVRAAAARSGARSLQQACGRVHEVVWDRVDEGLAHGIAATYHSVVVDATPATRPGELSRVLATCVEGDTLRGTVINDG